MKIGIITFWQSKDNYGQILQCWALQKHLKSFGHEIFLIKYTHLTPKSTNYEILLKILKVYPIFKSIYNKLKKILKNKNKYINKIDRGFDKFKKENITAYNKIYRNIYELKSDPPKADCYIVGSDQVWAQLVNKKNNEIFFLNFGSKKTKRISYAASFAMDNYPNNLFNNLKKNLSRFDAISVREKSGVEICKRIGFDAKLVLDPTLLINRDNYLEFIDRNDKPKAEYVYLYILNINNKEEIHYENISNFFNSKKINLKLTTASGVNHLSLSFDGADLVYPTIEEWLSYIFYSELVLTTSFHGVALSIKLNKSFIYIPLSDKYAESNNRVYSLLEQLDLNNRILHKFEDLENIITDDINWSKTNQKLEKLVQSSNYFLFSNLK